MHLRDKEHNPPHLHAFYGNEAATFYLSNGEIFEGAFPYKAKKLVKKFIEKYQKEVTYSRHLKKWGLLAR